MGLTNLVASSALFFPISGAQLFGGIAEKLGG